MQRVERRVTLLPDPEPREVKHLLISTDDHVIEPPDMFEGRMPARVVDQAPRIVERDGVQGWALEDRFLPNMGLNAVAGRPPEEWNDDPRNFDEIRPGCWKIEDRIGDMDINGVYASVCFPSRVAGFGGVRFAELHDQDLGLACVRAWNDWHLEAWAAPHPERIIPLQLPWLVDPAIAGDEVRANAARGFKAVTFPEVPAAIGLPSIFGDDWDPFLAACEETETVVCLHTGASGSILGFDPLAPGDLQVSLFPAYGLVAAAQWLWSGKLTRFPGLKLTLAEGGIGWVPMLIDRLNYMEDHAGKAFHGWRDPDFSPADVLRRNFWFCAFEDPAGIQLRYQIGVENITLETDYPHGDGTWPDSQAFVDRLLAGLPDDEVRMITHENAARLFRHPLPTRV